MDQASLSSALSGLRLPKILLFEQIDSTNTQAMNLMNDGANEYTLLVAERQTAGRGRMNRQWVTTPGSSLAFTIILRPLPEELQRMGFFSFLGALAVCLAIEGHCPVRSLVKWPNDVLIDGMKTAGVLAESAFQGASPGAIALGIGVNLLAGSVPPSADLLFPATCVEHHCSSLPSREEFLAAVIKNLLDWRPRLLHKEFISAYRSRLAFAGQKVVLCPPAAGEVEGILQGVDEEGQLLIGTRDGETRAFPVGDLKLRPIDIKP